MDSQTSHHPYLHFQVNPPICLVSFAGIKIRGQFLKNEHMGFYGDCCVKPVHKVMASFHTICSQLLGEASLDFLPSFYMSFTIR